jgi:hypothetical protein
MAEWYEVFDDVEALRATRRRVGRLLTASALGSGAVGAFAPLAVFWAPGGRAVVIAVAVVGALVAALHLGRALGALRGVLWCVKLSVRRVVGYDYGRRQTALAWTAVERVELDDGGLLLVGRDDRGAVRRLRVPGTFPDYARLSHRVVDYAEAFGCPVHVEGRPWQHLDLYTTFPFLREETGV